MAGTHPEAQPAYGPPALQDGLHGAARTDPYPKRRRRTASPASEKSDYSSGSSESERPATEWARHSEQAGHRLSHPSDPYAHLPPPSRANNANDQRYPPTHQQHYGGHGSTQGYPPHDQLDPYQRYPYGGYSSMLRQGHYDSQYEAYYRQHYGQQYPPQQSSSAPYYAQQGGGAYASPAVGCAPSGYAHPPPPPPPPAYGHPPMGYPPAPGYGPHEGYPPAHCYPPPAYGPPPHMGHVSSPGYLTHGSPHDLAISSDGRRSPRPGGGGGGAGGKKTKEPGTGKARRNKRKRAQSQATSDVQREAQKPPGPECKLTLEEILPRLVEAAQEQDGSRFLQMRLADGYPDEDRDQIYAGILPAVVKLAGDVFGNFVVQKLLERGSDAQRRSLAAQLKTDVVKLSNHRFGCRVIQKTLQLLPPEAQQVLVKDLEGEVLDCIENMHGNHVIQKCVEHMHPDAVGFIIDAVSSRAEQMASHMYGCRVLQRLLERCAPHRLEGLVEGLLQRVDKLARDKHGNYVVQCILQNGRAADQQRVIEVIKRDLVDFAKNKVSSNVVEKCFEAATVGPHAQSLKEERAGLMRAVLGDVNDAHAPLHQMMHDKFGNYAVQCIIKHSQGDEREALRQRITTVEPELLKSATGRHIIAALHKAA